jgi:hypothetical protein
MDTSGWGLAAAPPLLRSAPHSLHVVSHATFTCSCFEATPITYSEACRCPSICKQFLSVQSLPRQELAHAASLPPHPAHCYTEGDVVILREKRASRGHSNEGVLTKLGQSKTLNTHRGVVQHSDIIGKQPRQVVQSSKGTVFRLHEPTLGEYVRLTPRLVTPVRFPPYYSAEQKVNITRSTLKMQT